MCAGTRRHRQSPRELGRSRLLRRARRPRRACRRPPAIEQRPCDADRARTPRGRARGRVHDGSDRRRVSTALSVLTDMKPSIAFFGSSLVSAYWNGAATYYRGIIRAIAARGYRVTFYEPDVFDRQRHRDIEDPDWARVVVYSADGEMGV